MQFICTLKGSMPKEDMSLKRMTPVRNFHMRFWQFMVIFVLFYKCFSQSINQNTQETILHCQYHLYLHIADWLYAGPSVALSAWPTWVCVSPNDNRRILNWRANSFISSKLIPSTVVLSVEFPTVSDEEKKMSMSIWLPTMPSWRKVQRKR